MSDVTRRKALTLLGTMPLAAAALATPGGTLAAETLEEMDRDLLSESARKAHASGRFVPEFFTEQEWRTVRVLVDLIIPRDARSGSATDAAVPEFMDFTLIDRPNMQTRMRGGLRWMDAESRRRFERDFADLGGPEQRAILDDIAYPDEVAPGMGHGASFFSFLRDFTASGFFSSRVGMDDLRYTGNRAIRWNGCPPEALERLGVSYDLMGSEDE